MPTDEELKKALKAFKKRLKLARLDQESKLTSRALTGGHRSDIAAIQPPNDWGRDVWEALAERGDLKRAGPGFYTLP